MPMMTLIHNNQPKIGVCNREEWRRRCDNWESMADDTEARWYVCMMAA
jgi:hypothetical protein